MQVLVDGVEVGRYQPPNGEYTPYETGPFRVAAGSHTLALVGAGTCCTDFTAFVDDVRIVGAGNTLATSTVIASSSNPVNAGVAVTFTATVTGANPAGFVLFSDNGNPIEGCTNATVSATGSVRTASCTTSYGAAGSHAIVASYGGDATNAGSVSATLVQTVDAALTPTAIALSSSANPAVAGTSITFAAHVSGNLPSGTVTFTQGGVTIAGCNARPLSSASATCTTSLPIGQHPITAVYSGDAINAGSQSSPLTQGINPVPANTTTAIASSGNPSTQGSAVQFTATVTGVLPSGTVGFFEGATPITGCTANALTGSGNVRLATCTTSALAAGSYAISAVYDGDAANAGSISNPLTQIVNAAPAGGVPNRSFELPRLQGDYAYNPVGANWAFSSSAGITGNRNAFTSGNPDAPDGLQVAFLQNRGSITQKITVAAGTYRVSFQGAQRANWQDGVQVVRILVDGVPRGDFQPPGIAYTYFETAPLTLSAGSHTLALEGAGDGGFDFTALVDDVTLTMVP